MKAKSFMVIAGEASGDLLAAELVQALREELTNVEATPTPDYQPLHASLEPRFFGAGGPRMAAAGVELAFDLTAHSVVGLSDVAKNLITLRRLFHQLYRQALEREPDAIICVDFSEFNRRFAHAIKEYTRSHRDWFHDWDPLLVRYVSPQVWASRPGRAYQVAQDHDLILSIIPFEKEWYARRVPQLRVEYVGHPVLDRYPNAERGARIADSVDHKRAPVSVSSPHVEDRLSRSDSPSLLLLPGSRVSELRRHLPVMFSAVAKLRAGFPSLHARVVLPNDRMKELAAAASPPSEVVVQTGGLAEALNDADLAIASTGTVTMECTYFGVPAVTLYKTSWFNYQVAKRLVTIKSLTAPNLLANEPVFPEFIQGDANAENIARAAAELLRDRQRRQQIKDKLAEIVASLGPAGTTRRAATTIVKLLTTRAQTV
jgi:lipid-A-disaccharide synthase